MTIIVGVVMVLVAAGVIGYPFWKKGPRAIASGRGDRADMALAASEAMSKELESDYRSGILTKNEYDQIRAEYRPIHSPGIAEEVAPTDIAGQIEARVSQLRRGRQKPVATEELRLPAKEETGRDLPGVMAGEGRARCPKCGALYQEGDRFCGHCGARLRAGRDAQ